MVSAQCPSGRERGRSGSLHVSQKVDYSLFFLTSLSSHNVPCSTRMIAKEGGLSFSFLQKIAHLLKRAGLVAALRGKEGGYVLARPLRRMTVKDVIEAVDGTVAVSACSDHEKRKTLCPRRNFCRVQSELHVMQRKIVDTYFSKKLSDFIIQK